MAVQLGRKILLKIDENGVGGSGANWLTFAQQTSGGISFSTDTEDATHKDNYGWGTQIPKKVSWSISLEGYVDPTSTAYSIAYNALVAQNPVWIQIDETLAGGSKREGQGYITSLEQNFGVDDLWNYSIEIQGNGSLVLSP